MREERRQLVGDTPEQRSATFWKLRDEEKWNVLVTHYLSACVAYYHWDEKWMEDDDFDMLCFDLYKHFDSLTHPHKYLLDKDALLAGTGFHLGQFEYPMMTRRAAWVVLHPRDPMCREMPGG